MPGTELMKQFIDRARRIQARVERVDGVGEVVDYIRREARGPVLLPAAPSIDRLGLAEHLEAASLELLRDFGRSEAAQRCCGLTGANFALADTGTLVLESTSEQLRLATTLTEQHFALLDPRKILADGLAAVPYLREFHRRSERNYLAYISGPSRTADIERVLTIGVHGPKELHILLVENLSDDPYEI